MKEAFAVEADAALVKDETVPRRLGLLGHFMRTRQSAMTAVAVALFVVFSFTAPQFLTVVNLLDTIRAFTFVMIIAVGMTYLFIVGEFDLSLGALFGFSSMFAASLVVHGVAFWLVCLLTILIGCLVGAINAAFTLAGIPSFIVTIGMLSLLQGATLLISAGITISLSLEFQPGFVSIASGNVGPISAQVLWAVGVVVVGGLVLRFTSFGYHVYATGGNERAARQSGINVAFTKMACFVLAGGLAGLSGLLLLGWLRAASATTGLGEFLFQAVGAAIIGGVSLQGGEGSVYGTLVGAVILAFLMNGLVLIGVNPGFNIFLTGALIVGAGSLDAGLRRAVREMVRLRLRSRSTERR